MGMGFTDLVDDVLLKIAYECTPSEVIALERTCKVLHNIYSQPNRPLWLYHLQQLDDFHAPNLPPHVSVDSLTSLELKRLVSHAVNGYANWNAPSTTGPRISRRRIIDLKNKGGLLGDLRQHERRREIIKIVPGGKFLFVLWSEGYLQCWSVERNDVIWTYPQLGSFATCQVLAYDIEYDARSRQLFVALAGRSIEIPDYTPPYFLELFWLNPETKRAIKHSKTEGNFEWDEPVLLRICGDSIILFGSKGDSIAIINRNLSKCFTITNIHVLPKTITVSDGYLIFVAMRIDPGYSLYAMKVHRIFSSEDMRDVPMSSLPRRSGLTLASLKHFVLEAPLSTPALEQLISANLVVCKPTWRELGVTTIYVAVKLTNDHAMTPRPTSTRSRLYSFQLAVPSLDPSSCDLPYALPPSVSLLRDAPVISIPLSHPYCTEEIHSLSHAGRGVLASVNTLHKGVRYYAFSFEEFFEGRVRESFGPIAFGRDRIAPGEVYMEKYSGALAFVSKDQRSLVIQYYD